jgi:predicted Holliday junction resolvase-like endonuclease
VSIELKIIFILVIIIIGLLLLIRYLIRRSAHLSHGLKNITSQKQSLSTKYGRLTEQFIPLLDSYPYDEYNFRFLGNPIDGIQFEPDKIIFVEFKSSDSRLSSKQKQIKELIENGQVEFEEHRISSKED